MDGQGLSGHITVRGGGDKDGRGGEGQDLRLMYIQHEASFIITLYYLRRAFSASVIVGRRPHPHEHCKNAKVTSNRSN